MKKLFKLTSLLLVFMILFSFAACAPKNDPADITTPGDTTDFNKYADIAGEYLLDASDLGMPMKWYIKITADGKFNISTKRDFSDNKGEGTVADKDGTYMFVYSDSTNENQKTATFTFEGKNMVFSTKVPIGDKGASVSPSEDGKLPTAVLIANEELLGSCFGTYTEWAGTYTASYQKPGTLTRVCRLELEAFGGYVYTTIDPEDPTTLDYSETGTYTVADGKFTFTSSAEGAAAVAGTLENYVLAVKLPISAMMSSPVDLSFYAEEVNGTFTASGEYEEKAYDAVLSLGGGKFTLVVGDASEEAEEPNYIAYGSFTVEGGMVTQIAFTTEALYETMAMDTPLEEIPAELQSFKLPVAESGISGELIFDLDDTAVIAFEFKK